MIIGRFGWRLRKPAIVDQPFCTGIFISTSTRSARDFASLKLRVNTIAPGWKWGPRLEDGMKDAARGAYRDELAAGLRFLRNDRLLLALAVSVAIGNMLGNPFFGVILPVFAKETYGSAAKLGIIVAATGAGQILKSRTAACFRSFSSSSEFLSAGTSTRIRSVATLVMTGSETPRELTRLSITCSTWFWMSGVICLTSAVVWS